MFAERSSPNVRSNRHAPRSLGVDRSDRRREDRETPFPNASRLMAAGFEHEGGGLWSREGIIYGEKAALQKVWAARVLRDEDG